MESRHASFNYSANGMAMAAKAIIFCTAVALIAASCQQRHEPVVTPWGTVLDQQDSASIGKSSQPSLDNIIKQGEIILATMYAPDTYYEYRSQPVGEEYMRCLQFAKSLGVALRVDLCKDTAQLMSLVSNGQADIAIVPKNYSKPLLQANSPSGLRRSKQAPEAFGRWFVDPSNPTLAKALADWTVTPQAKLASAAYKPQAVGLRHGTTRLKTPTSPSHFDPLFKRYAPTAGMSWQLLSAICRQESAYNPQAVSWAGACGLMQVMPQTAARYGVTRQQLFLPHHNIAVSALLLRQLSKTFASVQPPAERTLFVLAAYNAGAAHIADARTLARHLRLNPNRWSDVARALLLLEQPRYYQMSIIKHGYVRGSETVDYVNRIAASARPISSPTSSSPQPAKQKHRFKI